MPEDVEYSLTDRPEMKSGARELELYNIRQIMKTEGGRGFMWHCLQQTGIFGSTFDRDRDIHLMNTGKREHGLWLQRELKEASVDYYMKMLKEHENDW